MIYKNKAQLFDALVPPRSEVLDVGFSGQGIQKGAAHWPHALLKQRAGKLYGVDLHLDAEFRNLGQYQEANAEQFSFPVSFDVIFAGDLIEHLSNPGLFLQQCKKHLKPGGCLILTTPNTFNLFNLAEKFTENEPTVNPDHTFYFNRKVLAKLLAKNGFKTVETSFLYTLEYDLKESWKKKVLNVLYAFLAKFTDKYVETLVVVAKVSDAK